MGFHMEMPTPRIFSSYTPLVWEWAGLEPRRSMSEFEGRTIDETEGNILGRQTPNAPGGTFQWFWGGGHGRIRFPRARVSSPGNRP